ncbi:MAG: hypothetical protein JSW51_14910 [Gemmatimonadota bacterium]|nr:MAG: hypothetical protein JSW51_14910 [Gemmatimonadota bacterium]
MRTRSLILTLALPLLPAGIWDGERPATGRCEHAIGGSAEHAIVSDLIAHDYGVRERDLTKLCEGNIITGTLPTTDKHQMTLIGIVRLEATSARFAHYAERVEQLVATDHVVEVGQIDVSDLQNTLLSYPVMLDDVREVPSCEVGDCDIKLPQHIVLELAQLDHDADGLDGEVAVVIRRWLQQYLTGYESEGNAALVEYSDKSPPQSLQQGFNQLLADAQVLAYRNPRLYDYFDGVVDRLPQDMSESFVWSVEEFGMRPLTTVTHTVVHRDSIGDMAGVWVGMKLLYASHYLHASLRQMRLIEDRSSDEPASYLVCVDRLLFDAKVGGIKRAMVKRRLRSHLADRLEEIRDLLSASGLTAEDGSEGL